VVVVQLTNGFGNNIFQIMAGKLLSNFLDKGLKIVAPTPDYYAIKDLKSLGFSVEPDHSNIHIAGEVVRANDSNYRLCYNHELKKYDILLSGYFEDYTYYKESADLIKSWLPEINKKNTNDLVIHFRAGDRLFYKNEFHTKPSFERYEKAIEQFDFDKLHIVTDMPKWEKATPEQVESMKFHYDVPKENRVSPQLSADYLNSFVDGMSKYNPSVQHRNIFEDFNFIRSFDNILFQHGTLGWWAAFTSDANKVGVYGPWRPWKGDSNKNLSKIDLPGWFQWK